MFKFRFGGKVLLTLPAQCCGHRYPFTQLGNATTLQISVCCSASYLMIGVTFLSLNKKVTKLELFLPKQEKRNVPYRSINTNLPLRIR